MKSYHQLVRDTGARLKDHELGRMPKVMNLWQGIQWQEVPKADGERTAVMLPEMSSAVIALYPALLQHPNPPFEILREFGNLILSVAGERASEVWDRKLVIPTEEQVETARAKLLDAQIRQQCPRYMNVLDTYPVNGSAADRLVFIHVANALLANNIPIEDSEGVDIKTWGPSVEYCHFKRYHSIIPLTSHYCPPEVDREFGAAFAFLVLEDQIPCGDSSVQAALKRLVKGLVARLEAYPSIQ